VRRIEGKLKKGIKNIRSIRLKTTMGTPVKVAM
jgi:ribosomal protein L1